HCQPSGWGWSARCYGCAGRSRPGWRHPRSHDARAPDVARWGSGEVPMFKHRRRGLGAALLLAVTLIAGVGGATRAFASEPAVVHGDTTVTTNADGTFTAKVTIKNSGAYPGGVNVRVRRCANVQ